MSTSWKFKKMAEDDFNSDPVEDVFFTTQVLEGPADSLVRECVQNTLDAVSAGETARIVFTFSGQDGALHPEAAGRWTLGLREHLDTARDRLRDLPPTSERMDYIVVEDFGTRGLQGDFEQWDDLDDKPGAEKNDFCYFWHNAGRSRKDTSDRGRWGLGKTVFPAASRIHTMLGFTIRRNDSQKLLMGQSVLKIHKVAGVKYNARGFWANYVEGKLPLPVSDSGEIDEFRQTFGLTRSDEPGLSVLIPWPRRDITGPEVILAAIRHYYYPIMAGQLSIEVRCDSKIVKLNDSTILDAAESLDLPGGEQEKDQLRAQISLAGWGYTLPDTDYVRPKPAGMAGSAPKWDDRAFSDDDLVQLRKKYEAGKEIAVEAALGIQENGGAIQQTHFRVYLKRDRAIDSAASDYIKNGVIISGVKGLERHKGIRGIVVIEHNVLSKVLGDAENPAHTEWQYKSPHFADKYRYGRSIIVFVRDSLARIVAILTRPSGGVDKDLLRDLFFIELSPEPESSGGTTTGGRGEGPVPPPGITGKTSPMTVSRITRGFVIRKSSGSGSRPASLRAEAAYEIRRGNPFRKYDPLDFDFGDSTLKVSAKGAQITSASANQLAATIDRDDFEITVTGFDSQRDLRVRVRASGGESDDQKV